MSDPLLTAFRIGDTVEVIKTGEKVKITAIYYSKVDPPIWTDNTGYYPKDLYPACVMSAGVPPLPPPTKDAPAIVGQRIIGLRELTDKELEEEGWERDAVDGPATVLELDNGSILYPMRDGEGNGPGVLIQRKKDKTWYIMPPPRKGTHK